MALQLSRKRESGHVDFARLRDSPIIRRRAEAWAKAKAEEVEPAGFVSWPLLAPVGDFREGVAEPANHDHRPRVLAVAEDRLDIVDQILRRDRLVSGGVTAPAENCADQTVCLGQRFFG